ncbi:TniQ family protein [Streptomyces nojiriensis]|uniref:TniQ family protein n=1 Tax=Streptomyces nojiriensis TaxID=66374 RepID=UPI00399C3209
MTLRPCDGHAVVLVPGQRRAHRQLLWGRAGSRFCPACLEETGGRWQVTWRLGWSFACTRHHVLLADRCPACHRISPPSLPPPPGSTPPGKVRKPGPGGGPRPRRCHHPLADTPLTLLQPAGELENAQHLIDTALAVREQAVRWPLYGPGGVPLGVALRDVKSLGALVLNHATPEDLEPVAGGDVLKRLERYRASPLPQRSQRDPHNGRMDLHSHFAPPMPRPLPWRSRQPCGSCAPRTSLQPPVPHVGLPIAWPPPAAPCIRPESSRSAAPSRPLSKPPCAAAGSRGSCRWPVCATAPPSTPPSPRLTRTPGPACCRPPRGPSGPYA